METLTREHAAAPAEVQTPPETPPETTPAPTVACATCGAEMASGQEWCLECGTARPDRLAAARPSWRGGAAVLAVTGVLAVGAAAAAWAGLSADAKRVAADNTQAALPAQTQPAPPAAQTQPPPAPAQPAPAAAAPAKKSTPPAAKQPAAPTPATPAAPSAPSTPQASSKAATTSTPKDTTAPQHSKPVAKLVAVKLDASDAKTYNPYNRPGAEQANPALAVDGDKSTAWTATLDASGGGQSAIGIDLALGKLRGVRQLKLATPTPGMTIEIYGARSTDAPVSVQDPDWTHIATQLDVAKDGTIRLGSGTDEYRHLLIWITEGPPQEQQVSLGELKVYE